uniref:Uncharacterized protein n=1 Tax=Arundo donax TaxID=35708 RepID=A0A0A8YJZ4_ARUDO
MMLLSRRLGNLMNFVASGLYLSVITY